MVFVRRAPGIPSRLGILPGTFNPVTVAHLALAAAARSLCQEVLFVLPRVFPHKPYSGASLEQRIELLEAALDGNSGCSLGISETGLFAEIAGECRLSYGPLVRLSFLCGRDAAQRIVEWDYGEPSAISRILRNFDLLIARRNGEYAPPADLCGAMERLELPSGLEFVSATEVRHRLARGGDWEHLVPGAIRDRVRQIYGSSQPTAQD